MWIELIDEPISGIFVTEGSPGSSMVRCHIGLIGQCEIVLAFLVQMNDNFVVGIACRNTRIG